MILALAALVPVVAATAAGLVLSASNALDTVHLHLDK